MNDTPNPGIRSTEFIIMVALAFIAVILAGFRVDANVVTFVPDRELLVKLFDAGMLYIGGRVALKGVQSYSAAKVASTNPTAQEKST